MINWFAEGRKIVNLHRTLGLPRRTPDLYRRLRGPATRAEIAKRCGIGVQTVAMWEYGRNHPRDQSLWVLWLHFLDWTKRARLNPYKVLEGSWPERRKRLASRTTRAAEKRRGGTGPAPLETASDSEAAHIPTSPPPISEGGEKNV